MGPQYNGAPAVPQLLFPAVPNLSMPKPRHALHGEVKERKQVFIKPQLYAKLGARPWG